MKNSILTILAGIAFGFIFLNQMMGITTLMSATTLVLVVSHITLALPNWLFTQVQTGCKIGSYKVSRTDLVGVAFFSSLMTAIVAQGHAASVFDAMIVATATAISLFISIKIGVILGKLARTVSKTDLTKPTLITNKAASLNQVTYFHRVISLVISLIGVTFTSHLSKPDEYTTFPIFVVLFSVTSLVSLSAFMAVWYVRYYRPKLLSATKIHWDDIVGAVTDKQPDAILHHAGPVSKKLSQAINKLNECNINFVIAVRDTASFKALKAKKIKNVVLCSKMSELEPLVVPTVKTFLYVNNHPKNAHVIRFHHLNHGLLEAPANAVDISPTYQMYTHRLIEVPLAGEYDIEFVDGSSRHNTANQDALDLLISPRAAI